MEKRPGSTQCSLLRLLCVVVVGKAERVGKGSEGEGEGRGEVGGDGCFSHFANSSEK